MRHRLFTSLYWLTSFYQVDFVVPYHGHRGAWELQMGVKIT